MEAEILFPLTTMKVRASVIELDMSAKRNKTKRRGLALLVVLIIVMTITVLSLGFLSQSNVELACGENMILKTQMDYLAESAMEHAKGLILNPQDVASEYWTGATGQQLVAGSDDYYDVSVTKLGELDYRITSTGYREKGGQKIGSSSLTAELRLDPCIAYWQTDSQAISSAVTINGDVYCDDDLVIAGIVNGDVYAKEQITGSATGQEHSFVGSPPVSLPGLVLGDFSSQYYYNGLGPYSVQPLDPNYDSWFPGPGENNPACVYYRNDDLELKGDINITGMLVVTHDLKLKENCNLTITAVKSFPALIVGHDIKVDNVGAALSVTGFAQIDHHIDMKDKAGSSIDVFGALYVLGDGIKNTGGCSVSITAAPNKAAIEIWPEPDTAQRWSPAAGAFFKGIERQ